MTRGRGWLGNAAHAASVAAGRTDAWLPGSLCALGYLAWLPLLVTVAGLPSRSDLAFSGAGLLSSGSFPLNVLLLGGLAALALLVACLVAALGEAAMTRAAAVGTTRSLLRDTEAAFSILLIAALPAVAALAAVAMGVAVVAPREFGAPDLDGPLLLRIATRLAPLLLVLVAAILLGQAFGAVALRRAFAGGDGSLAASLRAGGAGSGRAAGGGSERPGRRAAHPGSTSAASRARVIATDPIRAASRDRWSRCPRASRPAPRGAEG